MVPRDRVLLIACAVTLALFVGVGPSIQAWFDTSGGRTRVSSAGRAAGAGSGASEGGSASDVSVDAAYQEALAIVESDYSGPFEIDELNKRAITGMLHTLDPHSSYFDNREYSELRNEQQSQFYGIGVTINRRNGRTYILSAIPGTPAQKAGLRYGDAIVGVDGKPTAEWTSEQILEGVRGDLGAPVELTVDRVGAAEPLKFRIVRESVPLPSIRNHFMMNDTVGYIGLTGGFSSTTDQELGRAIADLKAQHMEQLVLDLRRNGGGLLDEAIKVAQRFLPAGQKILVVKGREGGSRGEVAYASKNETPESVPLVVLADRGTASASEVVIGALQDHDRALVAGETSFGKGLVQTVFNLKFGTGLTLTTAKYYTPTGRSIQRDYSAISFYDYYMRRTSSDLDAEPQGEALLTDSGRQVYAGGGIRPDVKIPPADASPTRIRLFNAAFEFSRQLVAGQVEGLGDYKVGDVDFGHKLTGDEYKVTDKVIDAFRKYLAAHPEFSAGEAQVNAEVEFVRNRIREEVITAAYGTDVGNQFFILNDVPTLKALDALPEARQLAENARALRDRN